MHRGVQKGVQKQEEAGVSTRVEYKEIALEAVHLLCSIGYTGLHPSQQRRLWQTALDLDRRLHPDREPVIVWSEEEGDVDPPRRPGNTPETSERTR